MATNLAQVLRLMLVTDDALIEGRDLVTLALAAQQGGATSVQLRLKRASAADLAEAGRRLLSALEIPLFINDRLDVALAIGAAGVHLGPDDIAVAMARRIAPDGFIIGASVGTEAELENGEAADYWGIGPWSVTSTKADAGAALGVAGFSRIAANARGRPCVAIGGIKPADVTLARAAGAAGVAVVSGILAGDDVEGRARRYAGSTDDLIRPSPSESP